MADLTTQEIKGISARNLIWLLSGVIMIEFTILMSYNSITVTAKQNTERIILLEQRQSKITDDINDIKTRISILEIKK